jgi:putative oxidoreductase
VPNPLHRESASRLLHRLQPIALVVLRIVLGAIMIGHGYNKVFGGGMMVHYHRVQALGLPGFLAFPSAFAEFFGGILVLLGLFTRYAAAAILIDMVVAIWKVHWKNGLLNEHGYEFALSLAAICFTLICYGPGPLALEILRKRRVAELQLGPVSPAPPTPVERNAKNEGPSPDPPSTR